MPPSDEATATVLASNTAPQDADKPLSEFERLANTRIQRFLVLEAKAKDAVTKFGITREMLADFKAQPSVSWDELEEVTEDVARKILLTRVWEPLAGDKLPPALSSVIFDVACTRGVHEASKMAQRAIQGVSGAAFKVDGKLRAGAMTALEQLDKAGKAVEVAERVVMERTSIVEILLSRFVRRENRSDLANVLLAFGRAAILAKTGVRL